MTTERRKYKIGKISELMGMTSEALRYYEHEHIISPDKSPNSGYRLYTAWDVHMLIRARCYRRYGFTLAETVNAFDAKNVEDIEHVMKRKEHDFTERIAKEEHLLKQMKNDLFRLRDAMSNIGKFRIEYSPAMHIIETQNSYDIMDDRFDLYRAWIELVPFATSGGLFEQDGETKTLRYGLIANDEDTKNLASELFEGTIAIPSQKCLVTFFHSGSERELCLDMFQPSFEFLDARGLKRTGSPFARAVLMTRTDDGAFHSIYQGWTPFEGECEYALIPRSDQDK